MRRSLVAAFFSSLSACSSNSREGENGTGPNTEPRCRSYATEFRITSIEATERGSCEFDRPSLTMTCRRIGSAPYEQMTTWSTISDAVADNRPIGLPTRRRDTLVLSSACSVVHDYDYDSSGRLLATEASTTGDACGGPTIVYDAWDERLRPTHGTSNGVGVLDCMGQEVSLAYDDVSQTVTAAYAGGTSCRDETISLGYDADGIVVSSTYSTPGADPLVSSFMIDARAEICAD